MNAPLRIIILLHVLVGSHLVLLSYLANHLKEYSTLDIVNMGYKDANNIQRSISHYTVFEEILGYQWSGATA